MKLDLQIGIFTVDTGGALQTSTTASDTLFLQAYDVDGASYTTFATLTANNTPTMSLSTAVTQTNWDSAYTHVSTVGGGEHRTPLIKAFADTGYTSSDGDIIIVDTSGGATTINLPASASLGDRIEIHDDGNAGTANITIGRNGLNVRGAAADITVSTNYQVTILTYKDGTDGWMYYTAT